MIDPSNWYSSDGDKATETPAHAAPEATQGETEQTAAERMYPEQSASYEQSEPQGNPYALESDMGERMYGASNRVELPDGLDLSAFDDSSLAENIPFLAAEVGANQSDIQNLAQLFSDYQRSPNDDQARSEAAESTMEQLRREHGQDLNRKLQRAHSLVASIPGLGDFLDRTGAGNDPQVAAELIRLSNSGRGYTRAIKYARKMGIDL